MRLKGLQCMQEEYIESKGRVFSVMKVRCLWLVRSQW